MRTAVKQHEMMSAKTLAGRLSPGFRIGAATAAAQVEGATTVGGRSQSIWDWYSGLPEMIADGSDTSVTADHYHRYREDVELMRDLGLDAYRFSFSWTRLQPNGRGSLNADGAAFYDRLLDELLAAHIAPVATLFHWDLPVDYADGWLDRDTAHRFGEFAGLVGEHFGDRIDSWITLNEPATVTLNGYALGLHAPGRTLLFDALPTVHHQLLAHGLGTQALRAAGVRGGIGITNVHTPVVPASQAPEDQLMAALFDIVHNRVFADPVLLGHYPEIPDELAPLFSALTEMPAEDLAQIHQPLDFYGLNYYMPTRVGAGGGDGGSPDGTSDAMADLPFHLAEFPEYPKTGFGWPIAAEYFAVAMGEVQSRYGDALPPVHITENGASFADEPGQDGVVDDVDRVAYLNDHLHAALDAVAPGGAAEGMDLRGYFAWSLLDNWEWAAGFLQRFGIIHVDFSTGERTPKTSYRWLQSVLAERTGADE